MNKQAIKIEKRLRDKTITERQAMDEFLVLFGVNHCSHYYVFKNNHDNTFEKKSIGFLNEKDAEDFLNKHSTLWSSLMIVKAPYNG